MWAQTVRLESTKYERTDNFYFDFAEGRTKVERQKEIILRYVILRR